MAGAKQLSLCGDKGIDSREKEKRESRVGRNKSIKEREESARHVPEGEGAGGNCLRGQSVETHAVICLPCHILMLFSVLKSR